MAINNPYVPGDPFSYDLKWIIRKIKEHQIILDGLDERIQNAIIAALEDLDQLGPKYFESAADLISSDLKDKSIAYIEGFYAHGDGGANLYYVTTDYNDIIGADFYLTLDGPNRWALPIIVTPYVTPEMFGAKSDGSEDAKDAFNIAVKTGKTIECHSNGVYMIEDGDIAVIDGTVINGNGAVLALYSSETNSHIIKTSDVVNVTIRDLIFDGSNASGSTYASAIQLANASNVSVTDCTFEHFTNNSVQFTYSTNCKIKGCTMDDTGLTMAYNSDRIVFDDLKITNCVFAYVLQLKSCQNSIIENCHVVMTDTNEFGIMVSYGNTEVDPEANAGNVVSSCTVDFTGTGSASEAYRTNGPSNDLKFIGCSANKAAMHFAGTTDLIVDSCCVTESITHGMRINGNTNASITNCTISSSTQNGIFLADENDHVVIANNILTGNNTSNNSNYRQIQIGSASEKNVCILSNVLYRSDAQTYMIGMTGGVENLSIINNTINGGAAITNGTPDIATARIIGNGYGTYRTIVSGLTNVTGIVELDGGHYTIKHSFESAPGAGTWTAGDVIYKKTPTSSIPLGWAYDGSTWQVI